jgi:mannose-1-phosphate guanylyltransferase
VVTVLMAGGAGVRFWPLSTPDLPKQFLTDLTGELSGAGGGGRTAARSRDSRGRAARPVAGLLAGRSLYAQAVDRARLLAPPDRILVATSADLAAHVRRQTPEIPRKNILVEPLRRDTAAALIYAALTVESRWPGSVMIATPSDHFIGDAAEFRRTMALAVDRARRGGLGTIGIPPTFPSTEFGYLRLARPPLARDVAAVRQFVEKPDARTAARYVASGRYLWNSGMFVWRADALLEAAAKHLPDTFRALSGLVRSKSRTPPAERARRVFRQLRAISVDYAIMEKTSDVWCVPGAFRWSDVGNWSALEPLIPADARGNRVRGDIFLDEVSGSLVVGQSDRPIVVAGLTDCLIVQTAAGTLVCHKSFGNRLRSVINQAIKR